MAERTRRVALVTGFTSEIGLGIAHCLASTGCDVIVQVLSSQSIIDDALTELRSQHGDCKISFVGANFFKEDEIDVMCMEVLKLYPGGIDILINNAARGLFHGSLAPYGGRAPNIRLHAHKMGNTVHEEKSLKIWIEFLSRVVLFLLLLDPDTDASFVQKQPYGGQVHDH
ncbi:BDHA-like protein [Mya arenaria]|uniref:3-oxoacyl-[acyl-carrier-protein] reductase n=1 Tax=Mya arenaria TaxID=6604 RepID=A0ABY7G316_MYAAR|nr:BDHA-like protein [Mya arenaria]